MSWSMNDVFYRLIMAKIHTYTYLCHVMCSNRNVNTHHSHIYIMNEPTIVASHRKLYLKNNKNIPNFNVKCAHKDHVFSAH